MTQTTTIGNDLGTFEGFNFQKQRAIDHILSAQEVMDWDHDAQGEAEFWPAGDRPEVSFVFSGKSAVTSSELRMLDTLLNVLGDDSTETFLRIYYAVHMQEMKFSSLTREGLEDLNLHIFMGTSFISLRKEAAYELFELYYPEAYQLWEKSYCDGLIFDTDRFLDSPSMAIAELNLGDTKALLVSLL